MTTPARPSTTAGWYPATRTALSNSTAAKPSTRVANNSAHTGPTCMATRITADSTTPTSTAIGMSRSVATTGAWPVPVIPEY